MAGTSLDKPGHDETIGLSAYNEIELRPVRQDENWRITYG